MIVRISRALLDQILAHAEENPLEEACGLLFGEPGRISAVQAAANVATDRRSRFEVDPAALIAAHRAARSGGPALIGHYHSHPGGHAAPSEQDARDSTPGQLWLIVAGGEAGLFEAVEQGPLHGRFRAIHLSVDDRPLA